MRIVCLVKQVPRPDAIEFDPETNTLRREGVPLVTNPFDLWAVEHAAGLREAVGGEVVALSMGPPQAAEALREALAHGADRGVLLSDRAFAGADTIGTSRTLADALRLLAPDLVFCGRKTVDSETWQVPPEVAAMLGWPCLTSAVAVEPGLQVRRETDEGTETWEAAGPTVVTFARPPQNAPEPHSPAPDGPLETWAAERLGRDPSAYGQTGSPTRVLAVRDVTPARAGLTAATPADAAAIVRRLLEERAVAAATWEKPPHAAEQPRASYDAWVMVETRAGGPTRHSLELLGRARELSGKLGGRAVALVFGSGRLDLGRHGADLVHRVDDPRLDRYHPELWAAALRATVERHRPHVLLVPASLQGREYAPYASGALELGMTGDCVAVDIAKGGRLLQTKPAYGGNIVSVIMGATTPQLATVRARMVEPLEPLEPRDARAEERAERVDLPEPGLRLLERGASAEAWRLEEADVVVCTGDPEAAGAARAAGAAVAAPAEIGLLGRSVAPRLYVGCGVRADFQHLTGLVKAAVVVSVRGDLGDRADVLLDADPAAALPELVAAV